MDTGISPLFNVLLQSELDCSECDLRPRDLIPMNELNGFALLTRRETPIEESGYEEHVDLIDMRKRKRGEQTLDLDFCTSFFPGLPHRSVFETLTVFHESRGNRPEAAAGLDRPLAKEDMIVAPVGKTPDDDLWVRIVDARTMVADVSQPVVPSRNRRANQFATVATVLHSDSSG
jgi:hypothetical protein